MALEIMLGFRFVIPDFDYSCFFGSLSLQVTLLINASAAETERDKEEDHMTTWLRRRSKASQITAFAKQLPATTLEPFLPNHTHDVGSQF